MAGHANHVLPEAAAGVAFDSLAPHHGAQCLDVNPGRQLGRSFPAGGAHLQVIAVHPIHVGIGFVELAEGLHVLVGDVADRSGGLEIEKVGLIHALGGVFPLNQAAFPLQTRPKGSFW